MPRMARSWVAEDVGAYHIISRVSDTNIHFNSGGYICACPLIVIPNSYLLML